MRASGTPERCRKCPTGETNPAIHCVAAEVMASRFGPIIAIGATGARAEEASRESHIVKEWQPSITHTSRVKGGAVLTCGAKEYPALVLTPSAADRYNGH